MILIQCFPSLKSPLFIDPYFLRQAEIVRGPASSLYGSGGNGGVMSFTTLSARDLLASGQTIGGGAKAAYNDADKSSRLNARLYGGNDVADGLIALGSHDWNKIRQGGGSYLDPNDGEAATGLVKLGIQPVVDGRIELSHQFYKSDNLQVNNGQATDYRTANLPIDKPAVQMTHVDQTNTILKGMLGKVDGAPALVATLYRTTLQYESDRSPNPAITNVLYSNTKTDTGGSSLQGTRVFDGAGWGRHRVTAGIDYFKDKQTAVSATAANPAAPSTVTRNGEREVTGVFVQDEVVLAGGWSLTPSLRSDRYKAFVADRSLADNSEARVSPKLSVAWQDGNGLMFYGNLGEAFRAPTIVELYQNLPCNAFVLNCFQPNATLRPEIDRTIELGANFAHKSAMIEGDSLKGRMAWFDSRVTDLVNNTKLGARTAAPADIANCANTGLNCNYQFQNVADARRNGAEIEGGYSLGFWQFNAAYSRVRVENRGNGDKLFSPPDKLSLQLRRQLPAQSMIVFWNTTGVAAQDYDSTVLRRRPGYATHDLFASWMPAGQKFKLDVGITKPVRQTLLGLPVFQCLRLYLSGRAQPESRARRRVLGRIMKRRELLKLSLLAGAGMAAPAAQASCDKETDRTPAQFLPKYVPDPRPEIDDIEKYPNCPYCGMDRRYSHRARMLIHFSNDLPDPLCSIHCAVISLAINLSLDPKAIYVGDNAIETDPRPLVEVGKASFLVGSDLPGVMTWNSKVAYGSASAATVAQKTYGGQVMDFQQALKVSFADLADDLDRMRKMREERRKRAAKKAQG